MKYLNEFANQTEYEGFLEENGLEYHNVSIIGENSPTYDDYLNMPLTFQIIGEEDWVEGDTYEINLLCSQSENARTIEYRINKGSWETITFGDGVVDGLIPGDFVEFRSSAETTYGSYDDFFINKFECTAPFNIFGNLNSLNGNSDTLDDCTYSYLFSGNDKLISAKKLRLPSIVLSINCYTSMFSGCTSLTTAPALPATTLAVRCYYGMFYQCSSLTAAPALPATTLAESCYASMFSNCTSLTTAPELPATTLVSYCYHNMFNGCSSLTAAPELPATTLTQYCYSTMFGNCTSLTTAPVLPATTLATYCYQSMFFQCASLTTAPVLSATTLVNGCYNQMFYNCSRLNYIKCLAINISAPSCLSQWVYSVAPSGTFVQHPNARWTRGSNGIPNTWTVINGREPLMVMWIDDYPSEEEWQQGFYGYSSFDDYLDTYMEDPGQFGSNEFNYTHETVTYDGVTYYAWYCDRLDIYYLTNTINYNTLYNLSTEANHSNRNCPVYAVLFSDLDGDPYIKNYDDIGHILVKIDDNGGGDLTMWIDDFPTIFDYFYELRDYHFQTYDDYFDWLLENNPNHNYSNANPYEYYGTTIEYDGDEYYLWENPYESNGSKIKYLLTNTIDYNTLYDMSIESDYSNRNCPVYAFLYGDMSEGYLPNYDDEGHVLLKVENNQQ